jgi:hypothetical protein
MDKIKRFSDIADKFWLCETEFLEKLRPCEVCAVRKQIEPQYRSLCVITSVFLCLLRALAVYPISLHSVIADSLPRYWSVITSVHCIWKGYERKRRDSAVCIATSYGLDDQGVAVRVPVETRIFYFPCHADQLWDPPSLLFNEYRGLLSRGWSWPLTSN